jgi:thiol-disulfide isomerase/thioredoxin
MGSSLPSFSVPKTNTTENVNSSSNNVSDQNQNQEQNKVNEIPAASAATAPAPPKKGWFSGGNHNKVIVVKLWADWCGHCKTFEPEWKKLVNHYSKNPNVIFEHLEEKGIAKGGMAMLNNKYGNRIKEPKGFPTFYIFRSSDTKKQEPYEGKRTFEGMKNEIEKLLMHKGGHNQTVKTGGAKKKKTKKTMHRKRH